MKKLTIFLTLMVFTTGSPIFGQSVNRQCDTIFAVAEIMPQYQTGLKGLMDYLMTDLAPILSNCCERDSILITSIYLTLTIDNYGEVTDVDFKRIQATEKCKKELKENLMNMTGWIPGKQGDISVCCKYFWPVRCIKWE